MALGTRQIELLALPSRAQPIRGEPGDHPPTGWQIVGGMIEAAERGAEGAQQHFRGRRKALVEPDKMV